MWAIVLGEPVQPHTGIQALETPTLWAKAFHHGMDECLFWQPYGPTEVICIQVEGLWAGCHDRCLGNAQLPCDLPQLSPSLPFSGSSSIQSSF